MRRNLVGCFGFVLCGTLTACSARSPINPGGDSGAPISSSDDSPDAGNLVPVVIPPTTPSLAPCTSPYAPVLEAVPTGALLPVFANSADGLSVGVGLGDAGASSPNDWVERLERESAGGRLLGNRVRTSVGDKLSQCRNIRA